jgi:hypothetical protein
MYPSLYNGRTSSLLKPQLSTVHHRAKDSQASRTNILTAVLDSCKRIEGEKEKKKGKVRKKRMEGGRERERGSERERGIEGEKRTY